MSISFLLYNQDGADFRLTPLPDDAELSLSNANALAVLQSLGIEVADSLWPIACFRSLLTVARRKRLGHTSPAIPSTEHRELGRMTLIDCGRAEGYIERRLKDLSDLVNAGLEAGAPTSDGVETPTPAGFGVPNPKHRRPGASILEDRLFA